MMDVTPIAAQPSPSHLVPEFSSTSTNITVVEHNRQVTSSTQTIAVRAIRSNERPAEGLPSRTTTILVPQEQFEPFQTPNCTASSANPTVSRAVIPPVSGKDTRRKIPEPNLSFLSTDQGIPRMTHTVLLPQRNRRTIRGEGLSQTQEPFSTQNRVDAEIKSGPFMFKGLPSEPRRERLDIAPNVSPTIGKNMRVNIKKPTPRQFRGLQSIFTGKSSILKPAGDLAPILGASQVTVSELAHNIDHRRNPALSEGRNTTTTLATWDLPPLKQDIEISASIICRPPRYALRQQVERIARVLALAAFYGFTLHAYSWGHGNFLKRFTGLSRNYRYASTLAFTYLTRIEFPGERTESWFKVKRIDEKVADVRLWYWHRVTERARAIEQLRTSWMERVWRFLMLASAPGTSSPPTDIGPDKFGLWFGGVSQHLLADPDLKGQFETAIRFWIRRFYVWITRSGGGYPQLLGNLQEEMVQEVRPLNEKTSQDLWRLKTRCGSVHFIIGITGEVIGWVEADGTVGSGLALVRNQRANRTNKISQARTTTRTINSTIPAGPPETNKNNRTNVGNTWQDLRGDWREHASVLLSPSAPSKQTTSLPGGLLECVYRPDSKTVSHGIHESVKLPHHRLLAERWILAHVEPGGVSGKPVLDVLHGQTRRKEKIVLDLQAKLTVESVRCSGEKWSSNTKGVLAQGLAFVQTPGMGWFVLEETGQVSSCV